jgi:hypothetical protein
LSEGKEMDAIKVECTCGDGPDVLLEIGGKQFDLTSKEAEALAAKLLSSANQADELEQTCRAHDKSDEDKFCALMAEYILERGYHTRYNKGVTAERYANWVFDRATFDGQGGRSLTFSKTWDRVKAKELVDAYAENERWEEEDYC